MSAVISSPGGILRGIAVYHQMRDARVIRQGVDHRIPQFNRCDDP